MRARGWCAADLARIRRGVLHVATKPLSFIADEPPRWSRPAAKFIETDGDLWQVSLRW
jgi:hypothetical protein